MILWQTRLLAPPFVRRTTNALHGIGERTLYFGYCNKGARGIQKRPAGLYLSMPRDKTVGRVTRTHTKGDKLRRPFKRPHSRLKRGPTVVTKQNARHFVSTAAMSTLGTVLGAVLKFQRRCPGGFAECQYPLVPRSFDHFLGNGLN